MLGELLEKVKMFPGKDEDGYFTIVSTSEETILQFERFATERNFKTKIVLDEDSFQLKIKQQHKQKHRTSTLVQHKMLKDLEQKCNEEKMQLDQSFNSDAFVSDHGDLDFAVTRHLKKDAVSSVMSQKNLIHTYRKRLTKHSV